MFLESVLILKIFKNFTTLCNPILATCLAGQASRMPQSQAYIEGSRDSMAGQSPSREKDLEFFQKFGILYFSRLYLATCSRVEASVVRVTQKVW